MALSFQPITLFLSTALISSFFIIVSSMILRPICTIFFAIVFREYFLYDALFKEGRNKLFKLFIYSSCSSYLQVSLKLFFLIIYILCSCFLWGPVSEETHERALALFGFSYSPNPVEMTVIYLEIKLFLGISFNGSNLNCVFWSDVNFLS